MDKTLHLPDFMRVEGFVNLSDTPRGGTLMCMGGSAAFPIAIFRIPFRNLTLPSIGTY